MQLPSGWESTLIYLTEKMLDILTLFTAILEESDPLCIVFI